jgi:hypothetical protein
MTPSDLDGLEKEFLEGIPDEDIGMTKELFSAKTGIEGQDGGVVTFLLVAGIEMLNQVTRCSSKPVQVNP